MTIGEKKIARKLAYAQSLNIFLFLSMHQLVTKNQLPTTKFPCFFCQNSVKAEASLYFFEVKYLTLTDATKRTLNYTTSENKSKAINSVFRCHIDATKQQRALNFELVVSD